MALIRELDSKLGLQTGDPRTFTSFDELFTAFERQMLHFVDIKVRGNNVIENLYAKYMPAPFLSLLTDDCIARGKDYHAGGARYNTTYIQGVGIGTMTDTLSAIKKHVFEDKALSMSSLLEMLAADFDGFERERQMLLNRTPRYGNDDDYADDLMRARLRGLFQRRGWAQEHARRRVSRQPAANDLSRLLWLGDRSHT